MGVGGIAEEPLMVRSPGERALLRVLAFAHRQRLPPAPLVQALAGEQSGMEHLRCMQLARLLGDGQPVLTALETVPGIIDETTLMALRVGEQTGTLPMIYRRLLSESTDESLRGLFGMQPAGGGILGKVCGLTLACFLMAFSVQYTLPTFFALVAEFESDSTILTAIKRLYTTLAGVLLLVAMLMPLLTLIYWLWLRQWQWKPWKMVYPRQPFAQRLRGLLALLVSSDRPVGAGIEALSRFQSPGSVRRRLAAASTQIAAGQQPWRALCQQGLLNSREANALTQAPNREVQHWILRTEANLRGVRRRWLCHVVPAALSTLTLVLLAMVAALLAIYQFSFLQYLIHGLSR